MPDPLDELARLADRCVRCGLCLPHCPTYGLDAQESESPRGRISLIQAIAEGQIDPARVDFSHMDHCLGCRHCEAVCPARVEYGALLAAARSWQHDHGYRRDSIADRALRRLLARPRLLNRLLGVARWLWPLLPQALRRGLPRPPAATRPGAIAAAPVSRGEVALFLGCVARRYAGSALVASASVLQRTGWTVRIPDQQTCCGAQAVHAGDGALAARLASVNRQAFDEATTVLTLDSGCHEQLATSCGAPAIDLLQFLADDPQFGDMPCVATNQHVAIFASCTQRTVVHNDSALRQLLARMPGLRITWLNAGCCGAAGSHMLEFPDRAAMLREPLLNQFAASGATRLLCANIGCRMHLQAGLDDRDIAITVEHPIQLILSLLSSPA